MKLRLCVVGSAILMAMGSTAVAAQGLTRQQCVDYPFVQPSGEVTHAQLVQELAELEAVGYRPTPDDPYYPTQIRKAEKRLTAEYQRDCMPPAS
jgi:hypothetical protein